MNETLFQKKSIELVGLTYSTSSLSSGILFNDILETNMSASTTTTASFVRVSNSNSASVNKQIVADNMALFESQNSDSKEIIDFLLANGLESTGAYKRGFMGSLQKALTNYGHLSVGQIGALRKIMKERANQKPIVENTKSVFIGKVKDSVKFEVSLDRKIRKYLDAPQFAGDNCIRNYFLMSDSAGNRICYSGSSSRMAGMEEGKLYSFEAEVKDHFTRGSEKQTYIKAATATPKSIAKFDGRKTKGRKSSKTAK